MSNQLTAGDIELICVIIDFGMGSKIIKSAKHHGVSGATITLGKGTVGKSIWDYMGLSEIRKEIVFMAVKKETAYVALEELNKEFKFCKPNHGIAFTTTIRTLIGCKKIKASNEENEEG